MTEQAGDHPYGPNSALIQSLLDDCRVLGPSGIERIAWGRRLHVVDSEESRQAFQAAEEAALTAVRDSGRESMLEAAQAAVREITEGRTSTEAWRSEHGGAGEPAEDAALHAALALVVRDQLEHEHYRHLAKAMAEALPWLLPEEPPDQYREGPA